MESPPIEYRVEEIARAAGVGVDTVRFYQSRGLLPSPARRGRVAIYSESHLERLREIRELNRQGLKLAAIGRVLADGESGTLRRSLLRVVSSAIARWATQPVNKAIIRPPSGSMMLDAR